MMSECVEYYQSQAQQVKSVHPWLLAKQQQGIEQLTQMGFPTRHDEDWKYTAVDAFTQHRFVANCTETTSLSDAAIAAPVASHHIMMIDGQLTTLPTLPDGVQVLSLMDALDTIPEKVMAHLGQIITTEHAFHALNAAMLNQGLCIVVQAGVSLTAPLWITHYQTRSNQAVYLRHLIIAEKGAQASVVEDFSGVTDECYATNIITEVFLAPNASLTHTKVQRESTAAYHVGHLAVKQSAHSHFDSHSLSFGGKWVRSDVTIHLDESRAQCRMNGIYLPLEKQHMDHHTLVRHSAAACESVQDYKGIVGKQSRAVFNGRVVVEQVAQQTVAKQQNKNLLLSQQAEIDTKPQLEIFADDVVCTHGATVGQLDEEAMFYLATRGIENAEASRFLMQAFMTDNLRAIPNATLGEWIGHLFNEKLG